MPSLVGASLLVLFQASSRCRGGERSRNLGHPGHRWGPKSEHGDHGDQEGEAHEPLEAKAVGLDESTYISELDEEIAHCRSVYVGAAVTEIAVLCGQMSGRHWSCPQVGADLNG